MNEGGSQIGFHLTLCRLPLHPKPHESHTRRGNSFPCFLSSQGCRPCQFNTFYGVYGLYIPVKSKSHPQLLKSLWFMTHDGSCCLTKALAKQTPRIVHLTRAKGSFFIALCTELALESQKAFGANTLSHADGASLNCHEGCWTLCAVDAIGGIGVASHLTGHTRALPRQWCDAAHGTRSTLHGAFH